jgi:hypothetical protein
MNTILKGVAMPHVEQHEVIVGNIGTVYSGEDEANAKQVFWQYADMAVESRILGGRASGESVTWLVDGEIVDKFAARREG